MPSDAYRSWAYRVWDQLEERTGRAPVYIGAQRIGAYCPACGEGTVCVRFLEHPRPSCTISSNAFADRCSRGCTEAEVMEALFG